MLVLGQLGQRGRICRQTKSPSFLCSGNVLEVMSAASVWLEPEPKAHISSWRQHSLPCTWDQWLPVASTSLLNWCSFFRASLGEGLPRVHCKGKCVCTAFPVEQSGGEAFMQPVGVSYQNPGASHCLSETSRSLSVCRWTGFSQTLQPQRLSLPKVGRTVRTRN